MTGMDCDKQRLKSHGKQKIQHTGRHHTMFNNSSISAVTVDHCSVSNFCEYTQHFKGMMFDQQLKR